MRIYRQLVDGSKWAVAKEDGKFVLGDPKHGNKKHHADLAVRVSTEDEAIDLLKKGFSIRIETKTRPSMIRRNLVVDGKPLA
jgi:hypothetical protein